MKISDNEITEIHIHDILTIISKLKIMTDEEIWDLQVNRWLYSASGVKGVRLP